MPRIGRFALLMLVCCASLGRGADPTPPATRTVYLGAGLSEEQTIVFTSAIAAADPWGIVLLDDPRASKAARPFLAALHAKNIIPVGPGPDALADLGERYQTKLAAPLPWPSGPPIALWKSFFPRAPRVVFCGAQPRRLLLYAAALAGALKAPLCLAPRNDAELLALREQLATWKMEEAILVGKPEIEADVLKNLRQTTYAGETEVHAAYLGELQRTSPIRNIVATNPHDLDKERGRMSILAPWIAVQRHAALLLTDNAGSNTTALVSEAQRVSEAGKGELARADTLVLVANLRAIPVEKRPNPVEGKDAEIEMEPTTPKGDEPFTFGVGRLFHENPAMLALVLARQALLPGDGGPRRALVVSNPGGGLPLLETFSRHTAHELKNAGYQTSTLFENEAERVAMRRLLPQQDIFLWEGHYKTLTDEFGFLTWTEPLPPSLCFLQSCLALKEEEAQPLLERGALGIIGSSTRTYSGTGGAFTLAYFNALLYEGQTLGGALRQAKNYLLSYSLLKEKRLGAAAKLTGVNIRSAWAFSLWADPTLRLPRPAWPEKARDPVRHELRGNTLLVSLPDTAYEKVTVGKFEAQMLPNARLAGLLTTSPDAEDQRRMVPFIFAEVRIPRVPPGKTPRLSSKLPDKQWVFVWDARRKAGYLLVTPRGPQEGRELKFKVDWDGM